jgi:hypothetical protein
MCFANALGSRNNKRRTFPKTSFGEHHCPLYGFTWPSEPSESMPAAADLAIPASDAQISSLLFIRVLLDFHRSGANALTFSTPRN